MEENKQRKPGWPRGDQNKGQPNSKKPKFNVFWIYGLIGIAFASMFFLEKGKKPVETNWKDFKNEFLLKNEVEKIVIVNKRFVEIYIIQDKLLPPKHSRVLNRGLGNFARSGPHYRFTISSVEKFEDRLDEAQSNLSEDEKMFAESDERWIDIANNLYGSSFQERYDYSQSTVSIQYNKINETLSGTLRTQNLKPNFHIK